MKATSEKPMRVAQVSASNGPSPSQAKVLGGTPLGVVSAHQTRNQKKVVLR